MSKPDRSVTAGELLRRMEADPALRVRRESVELKNRAARASTKAALDEVVARLREVGIKVTGLEDLNPGSAAPERVVPVLAGALSRMAAGDVAQAKLLSDAVCAVAPGTTAAAVLLREFERRRSDAESDLRWTIGLCAADNVTTANEAQLLSLIGDRTYGPSRGVLVPVLSRLSSKEARRTLLAALDDPAIAGFAARVVGEMGIVEARPALERLASESTQAAWIRKDARQARRKHKAETCSLEWRLAEESVDRVRLQSCDEVRGLNVGDCQSNLSEIDASSRDPSGRCLSDCRTGGVDCVES